MITYAPASATFRTPHGRNILMHYRKETSDWNTLWSALNEDEYRLGSRTFSGYALDIGAHIGSVGLALAIDNPGLVVACVEPVPDNAEFLRLNASANGLDVVIFEAAAASPEVERTSVNYRFRGSEAAEHHAFIGNSAFAEGTGQPLLDQETRDIECISIGSALERLGADRFALVKIDCEACEWSALRDPAIERVDLFVGEWHPNGHKTQGHLLELLSDTHEVTFTGYEAGPGGFSAVRR